MEFDDWGPGQTVDCPQCGKPTLIRSEKLQIRTIKNYSTRVKKTEMGMGAVVQIMGFVLCFTVVGIIVGIPLIVIGGKMSRKWACSNCGNRIADENVKICPTCRFALVA
jgi:predicted RNA-binding Zn-ribbon protein involved in translation (DUF1610 family)